jgi:hypothetical protein
MRAEFAGEHVPLQSAQGRQPTRAAVSRSSAERRARTLSSGDCSRWADPIRRRDDEMRSLMSRWERALDGEGQIALIIDEAGIGKSRPVQRFHEQIASTPQLTPSTRGFQDFGIRETKIADSVADRDGFEPSVPVTQYARLATPLRSATNGVRARVVDTHAT